mgnify:CR=1 FL=1
MSSRRNPTKEKYLQGLVELNNFAQSVADKITFNFKFFQFGDNGGQSFEDWQREEILADLNNKLKDFSGKTILELQQDRTLEIYPEYPKGSKFSPPSMLSSAKIKWARLRITGRRRLIGFFLMPDKSVITGAYKNTFYIVFLDKNHDFAPSKKS